MFFPTPNQQYQSTEGIKESNGKLVCLHCFDAFGWAAGRASGL